MRFNGSQIEFSRFCVHIIVDSKMKKVKQRPNDLSFYFLDMENIK